VRFGQGGTGEKEDPPSSRLRRTSGPSHSARRLCHTRRPSKSSRDLKKSVWEAFLSRIGGIGHQQKQSRFPRPSLRARKCLPSQRHGRRPRFVRREKVVAASGEQSGKSPTAPASGIRRAVENVDQNSAFGKMVALLGHRSNLLPTVAG